MTCQELQRYWEMTPSAALASATDSVEVVEHTAACAQCHRLLEERKELVRLLGLVRDSAPQAGMSLDGAVIAAYRRFLSGDEPPAVAAPSSIPTSLRGALAWAAALTFACVVSYVGMLLFSPRPYGYRPPLATRRPPATMPRARDINAAVESAGQSSRAIKPLAHSARARKPLPSAPDTASRAAFQSLMYCDPISCPGEMDVIRLELPSSVLGLTAASSRADGLVSADVLVGSDGIARGIRVVE